MSISDAGTGAPKLDSTAALYEMNMFAAIRVGDKMLIVLYCVA